LHSHALPEPTADDVAQVAAWTHAGVVRAFERAGRPLDGLDETAGELAQEQPVLASCYAASSGDVPLLGAAPGEKTAKLVHPAEQ
jgi:hypothetical protein